MTAPPNTTVTPGMRPSQATAKLSSKLVFESVISIWMGFWLPVKTMGLELPWMRQLRAAAV